MENCTIYSHQIDFDAVVEIVKTELPKALIEWNDDGFRKSLTATIKGGFFSKVKTLKINYRQRQNPSHTLDNIECGLTQNLAGMVNFIKSFPAQDENVKNLLLIKVMSLNSEMSFMVEPKITSEFKHVLKTIIQKIDAIVFAQPRGIFQKSNAQHFLDKDLNLILDPNGRSEISTLDVKVDAKYDTYAHGKEEFSQDQIDRKERTNSFLQKNGIPLCRTLPFIPSENEVKIRSKEDVVARAHSLVAIAVKGEGIEQVHIDKLIHEKEINNFSPRESQVISKNDLDDNEKAYATWRYESLNVMLWALGKIDELVYPSQICDVKGIVGLFMPLSRKEFADSCQLKSTAEILDKLDEIYRMNWACVDARIKGQQPGGNINSSIVYERHYALNWLTNYQNQNWDDVSTNT